MFVFITACYLIILSAASPDGAKLTPLLQFNVFQSDAADIHADLIYSPLHIDARLLLSAGSPGKYGINLKINEPYNQYFLGEARIDPGSSDGELLIESSFNSSLGLTMHSQTSYRRYADGFDLANNSSFVHASGLRANYLLDVARRHSCPEIVLTHNLTTMPAEVIYFSSNVSEKCLGASAIDDLLASVLAINVTLETQLSRLASVDLKQIFVFNGNNGWESMNFSNPLMDINVTAEWDSDGGYSHTKKALFASKLISWLPSFSIEYDNLRDQPISLLAKIFKENRSAKISHRDEL